MYPDRIKGIKISSPIPVVPGNCLPKNLTIMSSNNNVDLIKVGKSIYMCFRTAPTHFASSKTLLHIMRSDDDGKTWQKELSINMGRDLREPRFLYFKDRLFVYFYTGGTHPLKFEPSYIHFCERINNMQWTEPQPIFEPGYVVWRIRSYGDTAYMSVYYGLDIYGKGNRGEIRLLKSSNGLDWEPISNEPQISIVGAEEAEFMFDENGGIIAIVRLEVTGGALICRATADNLAHWECKRTSYKVDSSLMFKHDKRYFVVGRRNIAGRSTREYWNFVPTKFRNAWNMVFYSLTRKRTCLYEINPDTLELYPLIDLPSKGDTAFAGIVQISKDKYYLVNYSSPLEGFDLPWIAGQIFGSRLYGFIIDLSEVN
ncbi:MAG: glycoside hydrolase [Candidatus Hydrogenedentes bacterium]|nr:glycoside hydrolase [Candidatus Hydrogenedentota bacterium]